MAWLQREQGGEVYKREGVFLSIQHQNPSFRVNWNIHEHLKLQKSYTKLLDIGYLFQGITSHFKKHQKLPEYLQAQSHTTAPATTTTNTPQRQSILAQTL